MHQTDRRDSPRGPAGYFLQPMPDESHVSQMTHLSNFFAHARGGVRVRFFDDRRPRVAARQERTPVKPRQGRPPAYFELVIPAVPYIVNVAEADQHLVAAIGQYHHCCVHSLLGAAGDDDLAVGVCIERVLTCELVDDRKASSASPRTSVYAGE